MAQSAVRPARSLVCLLAATLVPPSEAGGGDKPLTLEVLFSPDDEVRVDFGGHPVGGLEWLDDAHFLEPVPEAERAERGALLKVHARSGRAEPFYEVSTMAAALARLPGMTAGDAEELARGELHFDPTRSAVLINFADDLFYYRLGAERAVRLTAGPEVEVGEEFSPDGKQVSFVRDYNLHLVDVATQRERALTSDGGPELFYGRLDWVYQEEIYGRGNFKGYWWSPDSSRLAFLKLDESPVGKFTVVDHIPNRQTIEVTSYPLAGDPNPRVELGVVPAAGGEAEWIDTSRYAPLEHLVVHVGWTPDGSQVTYQVQDREQTWLDLLVADPADGTSTRILRETTPAFVRRADEPHWLDDGSFLWLSERNGYRHLYHYAASGELLRQVTDGEWEVRGLHGFDADGGWIYYSGTEGTPTGVQVHRVRLDGSGRERLTRREGTHAADFSPGFGMFLDRWSDFGTPRKALLHAAGGGEPLRVVDDNPVPELAEYRLGQVERLQVETRDGFVMEAMLIKPPDFDPAKKYPVLQYNYGGPHAPVVRDRWGGRRQLWHHLLATRGYVIWMCDNRSASGKGIAPTWAAHGRLGEVELQDIEDGVAWLERQPWVDPDRIGIWGWSYGGFMASFALTHSKSFAAGIAGAPVTDWHLYDSVYTERYMRRPQNNPEGYAATSVVEAAADLHGELLLLHGVIDDNVHLQNTLQLVHALQEAGKQFEMMLYPRSRHGVRDRAQVHHLYTLMTDFLLRNL